MIRPLRSKNAGKFEKLLGFAGSHSIVTRGSVSLSCPTSPHFFCFTKSQRYFWNTGSSNVWNKFLIISPGMGNGTVFPWDLESRDANPGILSLMRQKSLGRLGVGQISLGQSRYKILGTASPVPCPSLITL